MLLEGTTEGWLMVSISSLSCVLGASIVIFGGKQTLESKKFLSASMALGGGALIFNSLYTLLPASRQKFDSNLLTFICFFLGVLFTVFLTYVIQWCTPHAIHTCDPTKTNTNNINEVVIVQILQEEQDTMKPLPKHHHEHYGSIQVTTTSTSNSKNDYYLIGIQTAIAICIHKFPGLNVV
jgi:ZIP family zinc transporter